MKSLIKKTALSLVTATQEVAYGMVCETRWVNGMWVKCCVDSYGRWACVY